MSVVKNPNPEEILVAVDGSQPSKNAAQAAILFAQKKQVKIHGLYVVGSRMVLEDGIAIKNELSGQPESTMTSQLVDQFESQGDEVLNWLEQQCLTSGVQVTTDIFFGGIPEMILEAAEHALFLALGRRGLAHHDDTSIFGDHFRSIISHQKGPILIGGEDTTELRRIWIILYSEEESSKLISWGKSFQKAFCCDILISTYHGNETLINIASTALEQFEQNNPVGYKQIIDPVQSGAEIAVALSYFNVDLVIVERYQRNTLGLFNDKHPLNDVLRSSEVMVLAV
jgi:nucleotide-binding universal stress UspA family protein